MSVRRRVFAPLAALAALALGGAGCGGEDDFENEARAAAPVDLTASVSDKRVDVSPGKVGAGLVNITIANQASDPVRFTLVGPSDAASNEIPPAAVSNLKVELEEGDYEVSAGEDSKIRSDELTVGPARGTSQNELLLP
jgi:hypothetical protein